MNLRFVHNSLDMVVAGLLHHCKHITKFILLLWNSADGS